MADTLARPGYALSPEMKAEMQRALGLWTGAIDFSRAPDARARELDRQIHAIWNAELPEVAEVRRLRMPGDMELGAYACEAVAYRPTNAVPGTILYIHGGGWSLCSLATHERWMRYLANASGVEILGIGYRLAPENPFPAALHDVISALRIIQDSPQSLGLSKGPVVIAGDSAGANLALGAMIHESRAARALPVAALLLYGAYGLEFSSPSYGAYGSDDYFLSEFQMRQFWSWYLPNSDMSADPRAVPLRASQEDLRALPPLYLLVAAQDPLACDSYELKRRLDQAGRADTMRVEQGVIHGFLQMTATIEAARQCGTAAAQAARGFIINAAAR